MFAPKAFCRRYTAGLLVLLGVAGGGVGGHAPMALRCRCAVGLLLLLGITGCGFRFHQQLWVVEPGAWSGNVRVASGVLANSYGSPAGPSAELVAFDTNYVVLGRDVNLLPVEIQVRASCAFEVAATKARLQGRAEYSFPVSAARPLARAEAEEDALERVAHLCTEAALKTAGSGAALTIDSEQEEHSDG